MPFPYKVHQPDVTYTLGAELDEISGICPLGGSWMACVEDETRDIYELRNGKVVAHFDSGKAGDSEGIVVIGSRGFILGATKCAIYEYKNFRKSMTKYKKHDLKLKKRCDPEGLCFDSGDDCLLVACKGGSKKDSSKRDVYKFDLGKRKLKKSPYFTIDARDLREQGCEKDFNPSGIAIHPQTREIYLLGTRGLKMVVRMSQNGAKILDSVRLQKSEYGQPEGIGFTDGGDLFISSEAKGDNKATLYRFKQV